MQNPDDNTRDENASQAQTDATPDAVASRREDSDRASGRGSDANGLTQADEAAGEERKRIYRESGSPIVSRMD
jgi:hypothetical protein